MSVLKKGDLVITTGEEKVIGTLIEVDVPSNVEDTYGWVIEQGTEKPWAIPMRRLELYTE